MLINYHNHGTKPLKNKWYLISKQRNMSYELHGKATNSQPKIKPIPLLVFFFLNIDVCSFWQGINSERF